MSNCVRIFLADGYRGLSDLSATIIDKIDVNNPTEGEGFWAYKLNTLTPMGLIHLISFNLHNIFIIINLFMTIFFFYKYSFTAVLSVLV